MKLTIPISIIFLLFASITTFGQDYMNEIAHESCACMQDIKVAQDNKDKYTMEVGLCMIQAAMPYKKQIKKDHGIDLAKLDGNAGEELGLLVGLKMVEVCPDAFMTAMSETGALDDIMDETSLSGTILKVENEQFVVFTIQDEYGKVGKYYWLTEVSSNFNLTFEYKNLTNKNIEFTYIEQELFDSRIGEYRLHKVLVSMSKE